MDKTHAGILIFILLSLTLLCAPLFIISGPIFIYTFLIIVLIEIGGLAYLINAVWANKSLETVGIGTISGLIVSLWRDSALDLLHGMIIHYYAIGFIASAGLTFIGAISSAQNSSTS